MAYFNAILGPGVWHAGLFLALRSGYDCIQFTVNPDFNGMDERQKRDRIIGSLCHCIFLCLAAFTCVNLGTFIFQLPENMSLIPALLEEIGKNEAAIDHIAFCLAAIVSAIGAMLLQ